MDTMCIFRYYKHRESLLVVKALANKRERATRKAKSSFSA